MIFIDVILFCGSPSKRTWPSNSIGEIWKRDLVWVKKRIQVPQEVIQVAQEATQAPQKSAQVPKKQPRGPQKGTDSRFPKRDSGVSKKELGSPIIKPGAPKSYWGPRKLLGP